jgi:hypothetical protein
MKGRGSDTAGIEALARLRPRDLDPLRSAAIGARALGAFRRARFVARRERAVRSRLRALYDRRLEPILVAALVVVYLGWAFDVVLVPYF